MPLDPQVQNLINQAAESKNAANEPPSIADYRKAGEKFIALAGEPIAVAKVEDRQISTGKGKLSVRVYHPQPDERLPVLVFTHGGGFVRGSLDSHDSLCRRLANYGNSVVVAVDYRLAPEHKFPAAVEDAYDAALWAWENAAEIGADETKLAVGGDSAGGCLAIAATMLARERGAPDIKFQLLFYPATDATMSSRSYQEFGEGYLLTRESAAFGYDLYFPPEADRRNEHASPLFAADLRGLPRTFAITAEFDPLRDEGESYLRRLREAGVEVEHIRYPGVIHNFMIFDRAIDAGRRAIKQAGEKLKGAFENS